MKKTACTAALILSFAAASAFAADVTGQISGLLGEDLQEWQTIKIDDQNSTSTHDEILAGYVSIHLQGHKGGEYNTKEALVLDFTRRGNGAIEDVKLLYLPDGDLRKLYQSEPMSILLELTGFENNGPTLNVSGTATGRIFWTETQGVRETVHSDRFLEVDLGFSATTYQD